MLVFSISGIPDPILRSNKPSLIVKDLEMIVENTPEIDPADSDFYLFFSSYCSPLGAEETVFVDIRMTKKPQVTDDFTKRFCAIVGKRVASYMEGFRVGCMIHLVSEDQKWSSEEDCY